MSLIETLLAMAQTEVLQIYVRPFGRSCCHSSGVSMRFT